MDIVGVFVEAKNVIRDEKEMIKKIDSGAQIVDDLFGDLTFSSGWEKNIEVKLFNKLQTILLSIRTNFDGEIHDAQRHVYQFFKKNQTSMFANAKKALFDYYCKTIEEYRECFTQEQVDLCAPYISKIEDLSNLLNIYGINIDFEGEGVSHLALIFDATFEPDLGIGVLFEGLEIKDVNVLDFII